MTLECRTTRERTRHEEGRFGKEFLCRNTSEAKSGKVPELGAELADVGDPFQQLEGDTKPDSTLTSLFYDNGEEPRLEVAGGTQ